MKRGEVYYIKHGGVQTESEMYSGRPGIIVSDNHLNNTSTVVEVVYLTTRPKTDLPTHTVVTSCPQVSTSLCEQISSVAISRIGDYVCTLTENEMRAIDYALIESLGLQKFSSVNDSKEFICLKIERDTYEEIANKIMKG